MKMNESPRVNSRDNQLNVSHKSREAALTFHIWQTGYFCDSKKATDLADKYISSLKSKTFYI